MSEEYTNRESEAKPGDIIETINGNRYLILANGMQAYIGNKDMNRSDKNELLPTRHDNRCLIVGKAKIKKRHR